MTMARAGLAPACLMLFSAAAHAAVAVAAVQPRRHRLCPAPRAAVAGGAASAHCLIAFLAVVTGWGARLCRPAPGWRGGNWFWTLTLFAVAYVLLAALITAPFDYYRQIIDLRAWGEAGPDAGAVAGGRSGMRWSVRAAGGGIVPLDSLCADGQQARAAGG